MPSRNSRNVRTRTFTGCGTCRGRHTKCPGERPTCSTCRRLGLHCQGYAFQLRWVRETGDDGGEKQQPGRSATTYRQPLFSDDERRLMSDSLSASTNGRPAASLLLQLDEASEQCNSHGDAEGILFGPFGAFRVSGELEKHSPSEDSTSTSSEWPSFNEEGIELVPRVSPTAELGALPFQELTGHAFNAILEGPSDAQLEANFDENPNPYLGALDQNALYGNMFEVYSLPDVNNLFGPAIPPMTEDFSLADSSGLTLSTSIPRDMLSSAHGAFDAGDAASLLRYFKDKVVGRSSGCTVRRKSPWSILVLPSAMQTFAEMSVFDTASDARLATFNALLANSAFHLYSSGAGDADSIKWLQKGNQAQQAAKQHLKNALRAGVDEAGYKDVLMAVLSLVMASSYTEPQNCLAFLLDAERLIRLWGIPNPRKSYKMRLLHHAYTHLRIISESVSAARMKPGNDNSDAEARDMLNALRRFRISEDTLIANIDPLHEKDTDLGQNDIHLEVFANWSGTMYSEIYGVPESLMTLLSQTISLANDKDRLDRLSQDRPDVGKAVARHTKKLERRIWSWSFPETGRSVALENTLHWATEAPVSETVTRSMALAVQQALQVYFYRRIHGVDAMMLQDAVRRTLDCLQPCLAVPDYDQDFASSIAWPVFIAACEAALPELQEKALQYLSFVDSNSGFFTSEKGSNIVHRVWQRRLETDDYTISWPDVM